jgi:Tol biopolymer transport system component
MNAFRFLNIMVALVLGGCTSPAPRPSRQYTINDFMDTVRIGGASFSMDESALLVSSDETGIVNAYSISIADAKRTPVTRSTNDSTYAVSYFPRDNRVLFTRDAGGDEHNHLFAREADGTERDLTPGTKLKAQFTGWARDDRAFYVQTNERDKRFFDLYRFDAASYQRALLYQNTNGYTFGDVSGDGKWIALDKQNTRSDTDIFLTTRRRKRQSTSPRTKAKRATIRRSSIRVPAGFIT